MHEDVDELLLLYSAQSLDAEARARLEAHLTTCADCRERLAEWDAIASAVRLRAERTPSSLPALNLPLPPQSGAQKENTMSAQLRTLPPLPSARRRQPVQRQSPRPLRAALLSGLAVVIAVGLTLLLAPRPSSVVTVSLATETPPAMTPTPAPVQYVPSSIRGSFEIGGHVRSPDTDAADVMRDAGMNWMKVQLIYQPGDTIDEAESWIEAAHERGFKLLLNVTGRPGDMAAGGSNYIQDYAAFLGGVASLAPDAIEVWNEPNLDRTWPTGQISGGNYANLLRPSYQAIKAANPNVMVISAAPAPTGAESAFPGQVMNDDNWLAGMVAAGGLNVLDCVGAHYLEGVVPPTQFEDDPRDDVYTRYFGRMLDTYLDITGGNTPLCWTELGYLAGAELDTLPRYFQWASETTAAEQAEWLASAAELSRASGSVRLMMVWNVNLNSEPDMPGYSIVRPDGSCPACDALAVQNRVEGRLIPPGFVASEIPIEALAMESTPEVGERITILLETGYDEIVSEEFPVTIPYTLVPVIEDALLIEPRHADTLLVVLSPQDAALLNWLLREEHPLRLR